jgi:hypothetical protein
MKLIIIVKNLKEKRLDFNLKHCLFNVKTNELVSLTTKVRVDMSDKILEYLSD